LTDVPAEHRDARQVHQEGGPVDQLHRGVEALAVENLHQWQSQAIGDGAEDTDPEQLARSQAQAAENDDDHQHHQIGATHGPAEALREQHRGDGGDHLRQGQAGIAETQVEAGADRQVETKVADHGQHQPDADYPRRRITVVHRKAQRHQTQDVHRHAQQKPLHAQALLGNRGPTGWVGVVAH
jgi:hypothetical protein